MFTRIDDNLFLSSFEAVNNKNSINTFKTFNITHILTVAVELPPTLEFDHVTHNMVVAVYDKKNEDISRYFETCFNFIKSAEENGRRVLVISPDGKSRSVTIVVAYLMMKQNMGVEEALERVTNRCNAARVNNGFMLQLQNLERRLGLDQDHCVIKKTKPASHEDCSVQPCTRRKEPRVEMVGWTRPQNGWVKLNVDGACVAQNKLSGAGGVLRDSEGEWIYGFTTPLGHSCTPIQAELWGIHEGLRLAWEFGYKKVVLETDSRRATQLIEHTKNSEDEANVNREILELIWAMIARDWTVQVNHCYREINMCADWLAKKALNSPLETAQLKTLPTSVHVSPPPGIHELLKHDLNGSKYPRIFT